MPGSSAWSSARQGIAIGAVMSEISTRTRMDSGVWRPMRTLSEVSWIALYSVSPEKPAKSIVTFVASNARRTLTALRRSAVVVTGLVFSSSRRLTDCVDRSFPLTLPVADIF